MPSKLIQKTFITAITFGISFALAIQSPAEDWEQFRGPNRDSISSETGLWGNLTESPKLNWLASGLGDGYGSVSVSDGVVYSTGNQSSGQIVTAVNIENGEVNWTTNITTTPPKHGYPGSRCTPTLDEEHLYVVSSAGSIHCLKRNSGEEIWSRKFRDWKGRMMSSWGYSESPLVDGDVVVCTPGGVNGAIVALNKLTGEEIWATKFPKDPSATNPNTNKTLKEGAAYASIVVTEAAGVRQYVQLIGRGVISVRASDGELLWKYQGVSNSVANIPTVVAFDDKIFCSTAYGTGSALLTLKADGQGGVAASEDYFVKARQLQNKHGGMVLVDGFIYCGHGNGKGLPICFNVETGKVAWGPVRSRAGGSGESSVLFADGHIVYRFQNGVIELIAANPEKYESVWSFTPEYQERESWAYPVISNGVLYLREQDKLMSYQLK